MGGKNHGGFFKDNQNLTFPFFGIFHTPGFLKFYKPSFSKIMNVCVPIVLNSESIARSSFKTSGSVCYKTVYNKCVSSFSSVSTKRKVGGGPQVRRPGWLDNPTRAAGTRDSGWAEGGRTLQAANIRACIWSAPLGPAASRDRRPMSARA